VAADATPFIEMEIASCGIKRLHRTDVDTLPTESTFCFIDSDHVYPPIFIVAKNGRYSKGERKWISCDFVDTWAKQGL
jgi:hypothetical protein